jgi:hypothetical protein
MVLDGPHMVPVGPHMVSDVPNMIFDGPHMIPTWALMVSILGAMVKTYRTRVNLQIYMALHHSRSILISLATRCQALGQHSKIR